MNLLSITLGLAAAGLVAAASARLAMVFWTDFVEQTRAEETLAEISRCWAVPLPPANRNGFTGDWARNDCGPTDEPGDWDNWAVEEIQGGRIQVTIEEPEDLERDIALRLSGQEDDDGNVVITLRNPWALAPPRHRQMARLIVPAPNGEDDENN